MEQDICSFVLDVDDRMHQTVLDDRAVARAVPTAGQEQPTAASDRSLAEDPGVHTLEGQIDGNFRVPSTGSSPHLKTAARPSAMMPKDTMGEMLRVRDYVVR